MPPAARRATKAYGYNVSPPQWGALGPGAFAAHTGQNQKMRMTIPVYDHPASPSKHCAPSKPLPAIEDIRAKTTKVPDSTAQRIRLPAHTSRRKQMEARAYAVPNTRSNIMDMMSKKKL